MDWEAEKVICCLKVDLHASGQRYELEPDKSSRISDREFLQTAFVCDFTTTREGSWTQPDFDEAYLSVILFMIGLQEGMGTVEKIIC